MAPTPNHGYETPQQGSENWHTPLNGNFETLDADVELRDAGAPGDNGYDPTAGAKYLDTSNGVVYTADGSSWTAAFALLASNGSGVASISGDITGGATLTDLTGNNLSISNGTLNADTGSSGIQSLSGGDGINPDSVGDGDTLSVAWADASALGSGGGLSSDTVTVAGNTVSLGGSTAIAHADLSNIASDDHHTRPTAGNGLSDNSGAFNVGTGTYLSVDSTSVSFDAAAEWSSGGNNTVSGSASTVAGGSENEASAGSATVSGGFQNVASGQLSTVGGGAYNEARADYATIGGGGPDDPLDDPPGDINVVYDNYGTVGGGANNQAGSDDSDSSTARWATVGGGRSNTAISENATVGGGSGNDAKGFSATVGGGQGNIASGANSTIAGGTNNDTNANNATVSGGSNNIANGLSAVVCGGVNNAASGGNSVAAGGSNNTASGDFSMVGGGGGNTASGVAAAVPGGERGAAEDDYAFVWNDGTEYHGIPRATNDGLSSSTAVDGEPVTGVNTFSASAQNGVRFITGSDSSPNVTYIASDGTLALGGLLDVGSNAVQSGSQEPLTFNTNDGSRTLELGVPKDDVASNTAGGNVVAGHPNNTVNNSAVGVVIGGGGNNSQGNTVGGSYGTVSGGRANTASSGNATVGGGQGNEASDGATTVAGGKNNTASGFVSTVGGGAGNTASANSATVPGGTSNTASGGAAFAAGSSAAASDSNAFVWNDGYAYHDIDGDGNNEGLDSGKAVNGEPVTGSYTFSVSATGGVRFITGASSVTYIDGGSTGWSTTSSRAVKTNIDAIDPQDALDGVEEMEVATWEYETEDGDGAGTTHIGPMAEDFHEAFDVGASDEHINSINADGAAFAAIQGLSEKLDDAREDLDAAQETIEQKDERIAELEAEVEHKDERIDSLERRLAAVEEQLGIDAGASQHAEADD